MPATCVLCGASNPLFRVYRGLFASKPNLLSVSCQECGGVSSQLRTLPEYVAFAMIYSTITLLLLFLGIRTLAGQLSIGWIATIAATIPWTFLPAWWSSRQAAELAEMAPQPDLPMGRKIGYLIISISLIAVMIGAGTFAYLFASI